MNPASLLQTRDLSLKARPQCLVRRFCRVVCLGGDLRKRSGFCAWTRTYLSDPGFALAPSRQTGAVPHHVLFILSADKGYMVVFINMTGRRLTLRSKDGSVWGAQICQGLQPGQTFERKFCKRMLKLISLYRVGVIDEGSNRNLGTIRKDQLSHYESIALSWSEEGGLKVSPEGSEAPRRPRLLQILCLLFRTNAHRRRP